MIINHDDVQDVLRVNGRLIISVHKDEQIEQYSSRIEEVTTVNMIIAMPISKGYPIILTPGSLFNVRLVNNGSMYSFRCVFLDKRLQPFPVWIVSLPTEIIKIQQRSFVRIDSRLPVDIVCLESAEAIDDSAVLPAWTKDISGGGLQLIVQTRIKIGDRLQLTFQLPESLPIHAIGEVIRIHQPQPERELFWVGVNFTEIQEKDRTRIVRYIFQKQLECRRRGFKETR